MCERKLGIVNKLPVGTPVGKSVGTLPSGDRTRMIRTRMEGEMVRGGVKGELNLTCKLAN